ncbi:MAG TPA: hypothetical protein VMV46_18050 [Thermoanaerobaculia bacterium]|nr:hypothetical protein [Thermoanaerobaculia bacterium]
MTEQAAPDRTAAAPVAGALRRRLQLAGGLIAGGLLVEAITLSWSHPFSFMIFIFLSGSLVLAGVLFYLWTIVSHPPGH